MSNALQTGAGSPRWQESSTRASCPQDKNFIFINAIRFFLLVLVFFPSITFGVLPAEIFPWGIVFALVSFRRIQKNAALLTLLLLLMLVVSALSSFFYFRESDALRSFAAYLNAIAVFATFLTISPAWVDRSIKLAKYILAFLLILGLAQYAGILRPLDGILSLLVPRASAGVLADLGARGVTLLSSEPSRAGAELVYLYFLYRLTRRSNRHLFLEGIALIVYLVLVVRAAQPVAFSVFVIGLLTIRRPVKAAFLVVGITLFIPLLSIDVGGSRVLSLISQVIAQNSFSDILFFLANESGHRLLTIYAFFAFGLTHPLGLGVGAWPISSIQAIQETGVDVTQLRYFMIHGRGEVVAVRGSGVLSNMMLDIGILGTMFFLYWIFTITRRFRTNDKTTFLVMLVLLVKISFFGSVGEPLPWVATALILRYNANRNIRKYNAMPAL